MTSFHQTIRETHTSWKIPLKRWVSCYCRLHFFLMTTSDIQNETFPKQMLVRYTDLCLPSFVSPCRIYMPLTIWGIQVLIMWQDEAITGDPGMTSSLLENFEHIAPESCIRKPLPWNAVRLLHSSSLLRCMLGISSAHDMLSCDIYIQ